MDLTPLEEAGLSRNEAKIYSFLLQYGPKQPREITSITGVHRRNVYDALDRLVEKGLCSHYVKNKKAFFWAEDPEKLLALLQEKEKRISSLLPAMQSAHKSAGKPEVRLLEGREGIKQVFTDMLFSLRRGEEYVAFGITGNAYKFLGAWYKSYLRNRRERGIRVRVIFNSEMRGKPAVRLPLSQVHFLPKGFKSFAATFIYKEKVAQMIWASDIDSSMGIIVESSQMAKTYHDYFEWMWKISKR